MESSKLFITNQWDGSASCGHDSQPYKYIIEVSFSVITSEMIIDIDAPFHDDPPPPHQPSADHSVPRSERFVGLWDYEVVEVFIGPGVISKLKTTKVDVRSFPYLEINVGPHGHYYMSSFLNEANFREKYDEYTLERPLVTHIDRTKRRWRGKIAIPSFIIPEPLCEEDYSTLWSMNAYAIFGSKERNTPRTYLAHSPVPGEKPNFHKLQSFVPVILQEDRMVHEETEVTAVGDYRGSRSPASESEVARARAQTHSTVNGGGLRGFIFSPSTVVADTSNRLIDEMRRLGLGHQQDPQQGGTSSGSRKPKRKTIAEVARELKDELALPDIDSKFLKHIHPDEFIILYANIWKRKVGTSCLVYRSIEKSRILVVSRGAFECRGGHTNNGCLF